MADRIEQLAAADFDEAMAFLNRIFRVAPDSSFERKVAPLYEPTDGAMSANAAIRRDGRIVAIVGLFPITWILGSARLRAGLIGGVSVDPAYRRHGLMQRLMRHVLETAARDKLQFVWLGGQRQRYGYYGFERAGCSLNIRLNATNMRHVRGSGWVPDARIEYVSDSSPHLPALKALHDRQPFRCERTAERFSRHLRMWRSHPFAAFDAQDKLLGYAVMPEHKGAVTELVTADASRTIDTLGALMAAQETNDFSVMTGPLDGGLMAALTPFAESVTVEASGNWRIFDWPAVLGALLEAKRLTTSLARGRVVLGIEGLPRHLALEVSGAGASCAWTDASPALCGTAMDMVRLLGGPCQPSVWRPLPAAAALLDAWCPLPLAFPTQDHG